MKKYKMRLEFEVEGTALELEALRCMLAGDGGEVRASWLRARLDQALETFAKDSTGDDCFAYVVRGGSVGPIEEAEAGDVAQGKRRGRFVHCVRWQSRRSKAPTRPQGEQEGESGPEGDRVRNGS